MLPLLILLFITAVGSTARADSGPLLYHHQWRALEPEKRQEYINILTDFMEATQEVSSEPQVHWQLWERLLSIPLAHANGCPTPGSGSSTVIGPTCYDSFSNWLISGSGSQVTCDRKNHRGNVHYECAGPGVIKFRVDLKPSDCGGARGCTPHK